MAMEKNFDAASKEAKIWKKWEDANAFKAGANALPNADSYAIMIPPPNVTGVLHMGHAFNNTLQDILIRWHRMRGFDTLWQPGTDHAGIATQMVVERELAKNNEPSRSELGREAFLEKVWAWKEQSGGTIINQLKRLGASCDFSRTAFTMAGAHGDTKTGHENSANFHDAVLKTFVDFYEKGLIYKGKRLVNWDPHFETAISDLEVENIEVDGHMWHFKYPLVDGETYTYIEKDDDNNIIVSEERNYISIATTRPETMLGDGAVAVFTNDERYAPIVGKSVHLPLCDRTIPVIVDEYPDPDFGSGAVKITGAHDFNDYQVAKRNNIPMYSLMDTKGAMRSDKSENNLVPIKYQGMDRFEARKAVVADIDALGLMIKIENKKVMQPFGDRSKVVIEPALTDQWFVDTAKIVQPAINAVKDGTTKILPEGDKKVYFHWLENIEPWCISRQLWWGHQVPVWNDMEGNAYCAISEEEAVKKAFNNYKSKYPDYNIKILVDYKAAEKIMDIYAKLCRRIGETGAGQLTKMCNQIAIAGLVQGLSEALHFAQKAGLDGRDVVEVISQGAAGSWQMANRFETMLDDKYEHGFAVDWMRKDLGICLNTANENGASLPVTALVDQFYKDIQKMGGGRWDTSSLLKRLT